MFRQVTERFYIGWPFALSLLVLLQQEGITHAVVMNREKYAPRHTGHIQLLHLGLPEDVERTDTFWLEVLSFTAEALKEETSKLYYTCSGGLVRGALGCYAGLRVSGLNPAQALNKVEAVRPMPAEFKVYLESVDAVYSVWKARELV